MSTPRIAVEEAFVTQDIGAVRTLPRLPSEHFADHFVVTNNGMTSLTALKLCIDVLGSDRVLFAADHAYDEAGESLRFLDAADLPSGMREQTFHTNSEQVSGLTERPACPTDCLACLQPSCPSMPMPYFFACDGASYPHLPLPARHLAQRRPMSTGRSSA